MKKDFCTLHLIRHGETQWNREKKIQGHLDSPLSESGIEQAKSLARVFSRVTFSGVYSSDLSRAVRIVEALAGAPGLPVKKSHALRERNYGRFEATRRDQHPELWQKAYEQHSRLSLEEQWNFKPDESVESNAELVSRFSHELQVVAKRHVGQNVMVSTHAGCIRTFLMKVGFAPYGSLPPSSFDNTGYVIVRCDGEDFELAKVEGVTIHTDNAIWG